MEEDKNMIAASLQVRNYCSTCKRTLQGQLFPRGRKTCRRCLTRSAERARHRRARNRQTSKFANADGSASALELLSVVECSRKICTSCKCFKMTASFLKNRKTCARCTRRRMKRLTNATREYWAAEAEDTFSFNRLPAQGHYRAPVKLLDSCLAKHHAHSFQNSFTACGEVGLSAREWEDFRRM